MIELIAEHSTRMVVMRCTINGECHVTDKFSSIVGALSYMHAILLGEEEIDIWHVPFTVTHEFS